MLGRFLWFPVGLPMSTKSWELRTWINFVRAHIENYAKFQIKLLILIVACWRCVSLLTTSRPLSLSQPRRFARIRVRVECAQRAPSPRALLCIFFVDLRSREQFARSRSATARVHSKLVGKSDSQPLEVIPYIREPISVNRCHCTAKMFSLRTSKCN